MKPVEFSLTEQSEINTVLQIKLALELWDNTVYEYF